MPNTVNAGGAYSLVLTLKHTERERERERERGVVWYGAVEIVVNGQLWQTKRPILDIITIKRSFQIFLGERTELWLTATLEVINGKK